MDEIFRNIGRLLFRSERNGVVARFFLETQGTHQSCLLYVSISCSVQSPKSSRDNEGMLFINVEMSTMAAEHFEAGRLGQLGIEVNRLVERCIKGILVFVNFLNITLVLI